MSDAPEKILIDASEAPYLCASTFPDMPDDPPSVEYTRSDIAEARIADLGRLYSAAEDAGGRLSGASEDTKGRLYSAARRAICAHVLGARDMTDMKFGPWKIHNGGDIPVHPDTKVHVQYINESREYALENPVIMRAKDFTGWGHSENRYDIIAYREVIEPARETVSRNIYWNNKAKNFYCFTFSTYGATLTCEIVDGVPDWSTLRAEEA